MTDSLPLVEKYRPKDFENIISHDNILSTLTNLINSNKMPHLIFYGPPGTGKTTTIMACVRRIYDDKFKQMVLELNGSDDRGINVVREQIKEFACSQRIYKDGIKIVILDEADSMTYDAQFALRRVIENFTYNTRFCLICNYISKIIPSLQSRCMMFRFAPIRDDTIKDKLIDVANLENISITKKGIKSIICLSEGDMRKAYNLLQSVHMAYNSIDDYKVYQCAGHPLPSDIDYILDLLINKGFKECYNNINKLKEEKGYALIDIIKYIVTIILELNIPQSQLIELILNLSEIENNTNNLSTEKIQLCAIIGCFIKIRYIED